MSNIAFVFPGQGSQSIGMLGCLLAKYPIVREVFQRASAAVGYDVAALIQDGPEDKLNQTEFTQVAMLTGDVAVYELLMQKGIEQPSLMAGHSLGEYAALVCAKAVTLEDAVRLVGARGRVMQHAIPMGLGAMAAIVGLTDEEVVDICTQASNDAEQVSPANYNAIGQVVIAGYTEAVLRAVALAEQSNARLAKVIPVSVPCHCSLLREAAVQFAEHLAKTTFKRPLIDVISNVDLSIYHSEDQIRKLLAAQLYQPVRWVETIQLFKKHGVDRIVECGPGKVLSGLCKRIERSMPTSSIYDCASFEQFLDEINTAEEVVHD